MRDIRLVFQSSCACRTLSPGPIRPVLPASLWCQHRAIRLIGHGNTDETFQKEKNIGLGYWFNIINHGQESAINGVCFLLEADRWRSLRAGMRMGIVWPVQWTLLSSAWPDVKVHRKVCCRLHRCQLYKKKTTFSSLSVKVTVHGTHACRCNSQTEPGGDRGGQDATYLPFYIYQHEEVVCVSLGFRHSRDAVFEGQTIRVPFRFQADVIILPLSKAVWTAGSVAFLSFFFSVFVNQVIVSLWAFSHCLFSCCPSIIPATCWRKKTQLVH